MGMFRARKESVARALAEQNGLVYGFSVFEREPNVWYIGTPEQLERAGVYEFHHADGRTTLSAGAQAVSNAIERMIVDRRLR